MNEDHEAHVNPDVIRARAVLRATLSSGLTNTVTRVLGITITEDQMEEMFSPHNRNLVIALDLLDKLAQIEALEAVRERFVERTDHRELVLIRGGRVNCIRGDSHVHLPHTTIEHAATPISDDKSMHVLRMREDTDEELTPDPRADKLN